MWMISYVYWEQYIYFTAECIILLENNCYALYN